MTNDKGEMYMVRLIKKLFIPTVILIWAVFYYIEILGKKASAGYFIKPVFWIMALLYAVIAAKEYKVWSDESKAIKDDGSKADDNTADDKAATAKMDPELMRMMVCVGSAAAYLITMPFLGFIIATVLLLFGMFCWLKAPNKMGALLLAVLITAGMYILFRFGLKVPLYKGFLGI